MNNATPAEISSAIERAQKGLFAIQFPDGAWRSADVAGPPTTGWALVALSYLGVAGQFDVAGAVRFLLFRQLPDGSFPDYPSDEKGSLAATAACYAGLYAVGTDPTSEPMTRAWASILRHGGFSATDPVTQTFLAAAGLISPEALIDIPMGWMLIPGSRFLIGQRINTAFQLILSALPGLIRGLKQRRQVPVPAQNLCQWMERDNLIRYLRKVQDPSGNWLGTLFHTTLCAMTLYALGVPRNDPAITRALAYVPKWRYDIPVIAGSERIWCFVPYNSETWDTALCVAALVKSGIPEEDPRIRRGVAYMLSTQGKIDEPREWQNPAPCSPRYGGWAFEESNSYNLDCDSTSQVLRALSATSKLSSVADVTKEGLAWLRGMQNPDGGWPSFTRGQASKPAGPYPLGTFMPSDSVQDLLIMVGSACLTFGDPATEDLTGRVLQALGLLGYRLPDPMVQKAVAFVRSQLFDNGVWWGRWECNFLPSSAYILLGLTAVGEDLQAPYIRRAVAWIESHQNPDGGFGESIDSYGNLAFAGIGTSNPYVTGLVVSALLAVGGSSDCIDRAVGFLLATQREDGLWPGLGYMLVMNAPVPFYKIPADVWSAPLEALADYWTRGGGVHRVNPQQPSAGSPQR